MNGCSDSWIYVSTPLLIVFFLLCCFFCFKYLAHMLQLNSYKNKRFLIWVGKKFVFQMLLLVAFSAIYFLFYVLYFPRNIYLVPLLFIMLAVFFFKKDYKSKLPIVFTPRVFRLLATFSVFTGVLIALVFSTNVLTSALLIYPVIWIAFSPLILVLCNIVNAPLEKFISSRYIKDAKRILESLPNLVIVGVTGSYGKTSAKNFLYTILSEKYNVLMTPESYNTTLGVVRTIREQLTPLHEIFIVEMGARNKGDIKEICDLVRPKYGMITSIGEQHLETFKNIENIIDTKFELIDSLPETGIAFLNFDNEYIISREVHVKSVGYGTIDFREKIYLASDIKVSEHGSEFSVSVPFDDAENFSFNTRLLGAHNIQNLAGCIAVANTLGVEMRDIQFAVGKIRPVKHRLELLPNGFIDDAYNSNPAGFKAALDVLSNFSGQRILVTPGMVELGEKEYQLNKEAAVYAASRCDYAVLVGEKQAIPLKQGLIEGGFSENKIFVVKSFTDAMETLKRIPLRGKRTVLLENDLPDNYL